MTSTGCLTISIDKYKSININVCFNYQNKIDVSTDKTIFIELYMVFIKNNVLKGSIRLHGSFGI